MKQTFEYGQLRYDYYLEFSDRKSLGLVVQPNLRIIVKVPRGVALDEIEAFLVRKWQWLDKQLQELGRYQKQHSQRQYVSGGAAQYLGRQYMLSVEAGSNDVVSLDRGRIRITTTKDIHNSDYNKTLLDTWIASRRNAMFKREYVRAFKLFDYEKMPQLHQRTMTRRWGSYIQGKVILNPRLIEAPIEAIYYVCVHELCHVVNKKHDAAFYQEMDRRIANWREVKERLEIRYG